MRSIELLAPAKNVDCGIEAIKHGADAVYIGGPQFGARYAASNSLEDIAALCDFAHIFDAKVYVTINTILWEEELQDVENVIRELYNIGVDALIVQDLAILKLDIPPIALHASTQMDNRTQEKAMFLEKAGFSQIVLARELPLEVIKRIHDATDVPLEAFVHGALCVSYSGRCYASQHCFNRSANRGRCAQVCRMKFDLIDGEGNTIVKDKHLLSLRDMNRSSRLEEMMDAGVSSFKIEGRLKDIDYVKNVTAYYRQCIDVILSRRSNDYRRASNGISQISFTPDVRKSFNRSFTGYFIDGKRSHVESIHTPKSIGEKIGELNRIDLRRNCLSVNIDKSITLSPGDGLCFFDDKRTLAGCSVQHSEGSNVFVNRIPLGKFSQGTAVYRNHDHRFEKALAGNTAKRTLPVTAKLEETPSGYRLTLNDASGHTATVERDCPHTVAEKPQRDYIGKQLARTGNTPFSVAHTELALKEERFIPASVLSELRQLATEALLNNIRGSYVRPLRKPAKEDFTTYAEGFLPKELDYTWNVSNHLAESVYKENGAETVNKAYELAPQKDARLMTCKYCLRHALGACLKEDGGKALPGSLFLQTENKMSFRLHFDCKHCEMIVYAAN